MRFDGKAAIVTGAGSGIGAAIAKRLASDGASVIASDLHAETAAKTAQQIGSRCIAVTADVTKETGIRNLVERAQKEFGHLDVLVNNAGIGESPRPIYDKWLDEWENVIRTNLTSAFIGIREAARVMRSQANGGAIINISSILGEVGLRFAPAYTAAKHGLNGLTQAAALELAPAKIRVVAVCPAFIRTPLISGQEDAVLPLHPIGRLGEPDEVAALVAFLASDEAGFITGASYLIDGAYTAQ